MKKVDGIRKLGKVEASAVKGGGDDTADHWTFEPFIKGNTVGGSATKHF